MNTGVYHRSSKGFTIDRIAMTDTAAFIEHLNDARIHANLLHIPVPYTEADAISWIEHRTPAVGVPDTLFAIRNDAGALIGAVDAGIALVPGTVDESEIGYWLATAYWGRSIMSEAVAWLRDHALDSLALTRLTARVFSFNVGSARVLEKCGFVLEQRLDRFHRKGETFIDALSYAYER